MRLFWKGKFGESLPPAYEFKEYALTGWRWASRIHGPFAVETREGNIAKCEDGYLVMDSEGYPHPVEKEEFEKVYRRTGV